MTTDCIGPEDIAGVRDLPSHDPRRQHLEHCSHCRALTHAYAEFEDAEAVRPNFDLDGADRELADRLAAALPAAASGQPSRAGPRPTWRPRAWYAAAAVLLVCAGIFVARDLVLDREARLPGGAGEVRGEGEDATQLAWQRGEDGTWSLTWKDALPGAPVVVFLDADLAELARRPLDAPEGLIAAGEITPPPGAAYLQLVFEEAGDVIARSDLVTARPEGR